MFKAFKAFKWIAREVQGLRGGSGTGVKGGVRKKKNCRGRRTGQAVNQSEGVTLCTSLLCIPQLYTCLAFPR